MITTVDGKTLDRRWPIDGHETFESSAALIKADGWIVGRKTMQGYASKNPQGKHTLPLSQKLMKTDFVAEHDQKTYAIVIDPSGKLQWDVGHVDTEHVIEVLTEKVSLTYLRQLRASQVSYIFAGKSKINLSIALKKLNKLFGIKRLMVQGGGTTNGFFLNAGLLDELSLIIAPVADGEVGTQSVFDILPKIKKQAAVPLKLKSARRYKKSYMWLKFHVG